MSIRALRIPLLLLTMMFGFSLVIAWKVGERLDDELVAKATHYVRVELEQLVRKFSDEAIIDNYAGAVVRVQGFVESEQRIQHLAINDVSGPQLYSFDRPAKGETVHLQQELALPTGRTIRFDAVADLSDVAAQVEGARRHLLLGLVVSAIPVSLVMWWLVHILGLRPLKRAQRALEQQQSLLEERVAERTLELRNEVAERRRVEEELVRHRDHLEELVQERTEQLQAAQRIVQLGYWHWDLTTREAEWSDEVYRIFGYEPRSVIPSFERYEERIHPDDLAVTGQFVKEVLAGTRSGGVDYRVRHADGSTRWVHTEATVTRGADGRVLLMSGTIQDITERKQAEAALTAAKVEAERASRAKSEFLSRMSHELRTPMNAILGFAQVLELESLTPDQLDFVREIERAGDHLLELINELLDLARIEAGKFSAALQPLAVAEAVDAAVRITQPQMQRRSVAVHAECDTEACLLADPTRFRQILVNLLSNAAKYNREGGRVTVTCTAVEGDMLRVAVSDTGAGIAPERLGDLFRPFERLGAEHGPVEGTGIGLALSRQLAELMGGRMGAESVAGQGSIFWVELPRVAPGHDDLPAHRTSTVLEGSGGGCQVLYVEDNPANLRVVEALFRHQPLLRLISATTGEHGLELAKRYRPDAILLDIQLPGMDGYAVLEALKADPTTSHIPVIALSADAMPVDIERGLRAGFAHYLTKPVKGEALTGVLREALLSRA